MPNSLTGLSSDFSKRDIAYLIFKRRFLVLGIALTTFVLVAVAVIMSERTYTAAATLYIVRNLPPIAATSPTTLNIILDRKEVLSSEADLLASRPVAEKVADVLMARPPGPPGPPPPPVRQLLASVMGRLQGMLRGVGVGDAPLEPREKLIHDLLEVTAVPAVNSDFLLVSFESGNAEYAALVVNTFCEVYLEQRLRLFKRPGLQDFYDEQVERSQAAVDALTKEITGHKAKTGMVAPAEQMKLKLDQLSALYIGLNQVRIEAQEIGERVAAIRARLEEQPASVVSTRVTERNPILLDMQKRRANLAAERAAELNRFQEGSPAIQEIDRNIERLQQAMQNEPETIVSSESTAQNTLRTTLLTDLYRAEADLTAKTVRERTLRSQLATLEPEVMEQDGEAMALQRLNEALVSANRIHARYVEQREEARIASATGPGVTNAQVVSPASVPQRGQSARKLLIPAGAVLGLFIGLVVALVGAVFGQTLDRREDAERELGLPVLASLPELDGLPQPR